eukprot:719770-Pyramimonas_sp.AAC.1
MARTTHVKTCVGPRQDFREGNEDEDEERNDSFQFYQGSRLLAGRSRTSHIHGKARSTPTSPNSPKCSRREKPDRLTHTHEPKRLAPGRRACTTDTTTSLNNSSPSSLQRAPYARQSIRAYQHLPMPTARKLRQRILCSWAELSSQPNSNAVRQSGNSDDNAGALLGAP